MVLFIVTFFVCVLSLSCLLTLITINRLSRRLASFGIYSYHYFNPLSILLSCAGGWTGGALRPGLGLALIDTLGQWSTEGALGQLIRKVVDRGNRVRQFRTKSQAEKARGSFRSGETL